ncbi:MAG: DUF1844 domain-containing protein [Gemmatimonadota bacterium]|nr:MAG: DUF1844 domain-containing protein [Gemmatimonadota bacterium]
MTEETKGRVDFSSLVVSIATSALAVLGQVELLLEPGAEGGKAGTVESEEPPLSGAALRERVVEALAGARQLIDTMAMLEEKTRGNLDADEQELLRGSLSELRIRFVSVANRPITAGGTSP